MAQQADGRRPERSAASLTTTLLVCAVVVLALLVCLALVSWFERMP